MRPHGWYSQPLERPRDTTAQQSSLVTGAWADNFRLAVLAYRCLHNSASACLTSELFPVSRASRRQNDGPSHSACQPCHTWKLHFCCFSDVGVEQHIAQHPFIVITDHLQITPEDWAVPAIIRVTFSATVTVLCIVPWPWSTCLLMSR